MLAEYGATQSLLKDLGVVTLSFASTLEDAMEEVRESNNMECHGGRRIKRARRVCSVAHVATTVYRFAAFVAMVSLEQALGVHNASDNGKDDGSATLQPDVNSKGCREVSNVHLHVRQFPIEQYGSFTQGCCRVYKKQGSKSCRTL